MTDVPEAVVQTWNPAVQGKVVNAISEEIGGDEEEEGEDEGGADED
jgi:hypothetical protein